MFQLLKIIAFDLVDEVRNHLNHMMPGGWFSRETSIVWPPRSPDFTPLNFFFSLCEEPHLPGQKQLPSAAKACIRDTVATVTISPFTGLEWPRGFQEVKVPRFHDKGTGRW